MRIVIDLQACQTPSSKDRGIGRYSLALALEMARQGVQHEIWLVLNAFFPDEISHIRHLFHRLIPQERICSFNVPQAVGELAARTPCHIKVAEQIREHFIASLYPDIVHVSSLFEGFNDNSVVSVNSMGQQFLTAVTLYDLIPLIQHKHYLTNPQTRQWYYRKLQSLKNAQLLLAISESSRQEAIDFLNMDENDVVTISSAIGDHFKPLTITEENKTAIFEKYDLHGPYVMYTGGIDHRKNIEGLILAFSKLDSHIRQTYSLVIVCQISEHDKARLQHFSQLQGLKTHEVIYTGYVPEDDLVTLYNMATLFVFPSLHEGFGLPVLEAMACGVPTIASNRSSLPEIIVRDDAMFNPDEPDEICAKIASLLNHPDALENLRQYGLARSQQFGWKKSARLTLDAFEQRYQQEQLNTYLPKSELVKTTLRPRLAFFSPLPPERSGIADYSASLLPELARYYTIDLITDLPHCSDAWVSANFSLHSIAWFERNAKRYDRILYHIGNSEFHQHMFRLMQNFPGTIVLHDFFLSGIFHYMDDTMVESGIFKRMLFDSHGYPALLALQKQPVHEIVYQYPANLDVLHNAAGVISHSHYAKELADQWYGPGFSKHWAHIPLLKTTPPLASRQLLLQQFNLSQDAFIVCSFGFIQQTKMSNEILSAWLQSTLSHHENSYLVFVGQYSKEGYGGQLLEQAQASGKQKHIIFTDFVNQENYSDWLNVADIGIQLRRESRGETSAAILDCLSYGIALLFNANGAANELPDEVGFKLADQFSMSALVSGLNTLFEQPQRREQLAHAGKKYIQAYHAPHKTGQLYYQAIENFQQHKHIKKQKLLTSIAMLDGISEQNPDELVEYANCIAQNRLNDAIHCIFIDVSVSLNDVALNWIRQLLLSPPKGWQIEPVRNEDDEYVYASDFCCQLLDLEAFRAVDIIECHKHDIWISFEQKASQTISLLIDKTFFIPQDEFPFHDLQSELLLEQLENWLANV